MLCMKGQAAILSCRRPSTKLTPSMISANRS
jgi:hypothetical protein